MLTGLLFSCMSYAVFLMAFITSLQHFWQWCALTWDYLCLLSLVLASHICKFLSLFHLVLFTVPISRLRLLVSLLSISCTENISHAMKTLRKVKVTALRSLSFSSNIWFILGLNSIDFSLCRERVPFSWCLGCQKILDCIRNNIKLWRFLSGLELQTLILCSSADLCSDLLSLAGLLNV